MASFLVYNYHKNGNQLCIILCFLCVWVYVCYGLDYVPPLWYVEVTCHSTLGLSCIWEAGLLKRGISVNLRRLDGLAPNLTGVTRWKICAHWKTQEAYAQVNDLAKGRRRLAVCSQEGLQRPEPSLSYSWTSRSTGL